jgi:hypothetical protein
VVEPFEPVSEERDALAAEGEGLRRFVEGRVETSEVRFEKGI